VSVVATAGHVDHGKSSLVLALTGTDPDRFAEEKRRGLTIDLGFSHTTLPSGRSLSFVDVPGHVRFLNNMLAGAGAVDRCLFVVAASEGWKPQSEEHLRILDMLGVGEGVVALTKVDLVDDDAIATRCAQIAGRVAGTFLAGAPVIPVAAPLGQGSTAAHRPRSPRRRRRPVNDRARPGCGRSVSPPQRRYRRHRHLARRDVLGGRHRRVGHRRRAARIRRYRPAANRSTTSLPGTAPPQPAGRRGGGRGSR
jgi:selenocysteine-specific elongation factor